MDSDILYIDHHNPDPPVRYPSADEEAAENSDSSANADDIIAPIVDDQAPEQNDSVAESSDQTVEQNDSIESSDEQVITTDETTEMTENILTIDESDNQEEETAPKEANTEDRTPDPFDEIQLKMMGYPLPTPEVSNLKPPLPPNANSETN